MRDFTLTTYNALLTALLQAGYGFVTFEEYCTAGILPGRYVILRHDVDKSPEHSLLTAQIEHVLGIRASYYFRTVEESNRPEIIQTIASLGHEIGYHYEDLSLAHGDMEKAYSHFLSALDYFRTFYPVSTICMHGAPTQQWDGRDLWKNYDYHALGIIGEPYLDVDFADVFYLTDTGRCWDGYRVSVRDKIPHYQDIWTAQGLRYHTTADILSAIYTGAFPSYVMMTTHPQRWTDNMREWHAERLKQTIKNGIKRCLIYAKENFS